MNLKQGNISVNEYIRKFEDLSCYAPQLVSSDALKVEQFLEGLKLEIYRDVTMARMVGVTYSIIAERALDAECAKNKIRDRDVKVKEKEVKEKEAKEQQTNKTFKPNYQTTQGKQQQHNWRNNKRSHQNQNQGQRFDQNKRQRTDQTT